MEFILSHHTKHQKGTICLISPALSPTAPAQPVSFLGKRQLHSIIATCHSQVNLPPSLCSGEQSLFSLSNVGALRLAVEWCSTNTSIWTSHSVSYSVWTFCLSWNKWARRPVGMTWPLQCTEGALRRFSALLSNQESLNLADFVWLKLDVYKWTLMHKKTW